MLELGGEKRRKFLLSDESYGHVIEMILNCCDRRTNLHQEDDQLLPTARRIILNSQKLVQKLSKSALFRMLRQSAFGDFP